MYKDYFNLASQLMVVLTPDGLVIDANQAVLDLLGLKKDKVLGAVYWELPCWLHSDDMQNRVVFSMEECALTLESVRFAAQYRGYSGKINDVDLLIKPIVDENENVTGFISLGYNVTELVSTRKALSEKERQMNALFQYSSEGFAFIMMPEPIPFDAHHLKEVFNDSVRYQKVIRVNAAMKHMLGIEGSLPSLRVYELLKIDGRHFHDYMYALLEKGETAFEHSIEDYLGRLKILNIQWVAIITDGLFYGHFAVIKDLTTQRLYERELEFYAYKDPLTGINNRRTFFNEGSQLFNQDEKTNLTLVMLDIDHFKKVNDTYGHDIGDLVLKDFSSLLINHLPQDVLAARYGGEEFILLFNGYSETEVAFFCESLRQAIKKHPCHAKDKSVFTITSSMGAAKGLNNDQTIDDVISRADQALYQAKQTGRDKFVAYIDLKS